MAILNIVKPEEAANPVKKCYMQFEELGMEVPLPFQMYSASPFILERQSEIMKYYMAHPSLSFPLLAHIRFLVAESENYQYCTNMNSGLLRGIAGLSDEQLEAIKSDPSNAALEPKETELLQFVLKAIQDPATTNQQQVDALREMGWKDNDIFDALIHGMNMVIAGMIFQAVKMGE